MRFASLAIAAAALLSVSAASIAQTSTRPAAPQVTMGADLKLLRFHWDPVPGATFYRLWIKPGSTRYLAVGDRIPASITQAQHAIAVHLQDWERTRYVVTACNSAGCTGSPALNPKSLMRETIGYVKASNTDPGDLFGREVALSDDGLTLAVTAEYESSIATGVNGDQADNSAPQAGAVYIYRRTGDTWRQEAYLKSGVPLQGPSFGAGVPKAAQRALALSGDGSIAAIGAPAFDAAAFGRAGEVYVFRRGSTGWRLAATLRAPELSTSDHFGFSVDISHDGRTIKITGQAPRDGENPPRGSTYIFRMSGDTWTHRATIFVGCPNTRMSGDGTHIIGICRFGENQFSAITLREAAGSNGSRWIEGGEWITLATFNDDLAMALNEDATMFAVLQGGTEWSVHIYRSEAFQWIHEQRLVAPAGLDRYNSFGQSIAFSRQGQRLVVGDYFSSAAGTGVLPAAVPGNTQHGAVFVYERTFTDEYTWSLDSVVKAPNPGVDAFGASVALSGSGRTLAVGALREDSSARDIDGNQLDESAEDAGAAYLY